MFDHQDVETYLRALDEQLGLEGHHIELVVCGGTALNVLGLASRSTKDIDVVGIIEGGETLELHEADLEGWFRESAGRVARDFDLPDEWINNGPTSMVRTGLPEGFVTRLITKRYGDNLVVHYSSRVDLIHFKLYAAVDRQGRHIEDLRKLEPSPQEMETAGLWCMNQDPSEPFKEELIKLLEWMGYEDVAGKIS
ncbi:MAG: nucleotidyl transferase AbiEii/AbiGii toxin family protein [Actinomycetota bacterium]|nr:nucleotidyl transferase AbiEii/AbiGii toxin family protein [Actinomycetota bacterium]